MQAPSLLRSKTKDPLDSTWHRHMKDGDWVADVSVNECMVCKNEFSFWNRKHHCRRCGAVVCDTCSNNRTPHIYRDMTQTADESLRVCDHCIQVIDEKIAFGLNQRFNKADNNWNPSFEDEEPEDNKTTHAAYFIPQKTERNARAVMTMGRYRAEIKESEGNRYIRDCDL
ncbi:hypothetical protein THRCLA_00838 [Thraustotheca clavata]|uniref:FYVE-type domain-containing protein n=1 Tax=Thraustotheca clavata TaxID=74557 RepID=A0A1W0AAF6_9STRA|nr:hypothetical protein THRCLA_00838 [Thraustotheca clavata]